jgi:hypothetical protein
LLAIVIDQSTANSCSGRHGSIAGRVKDSTGVDLQEALSVRKRRELEQWTIQGGSKVRGSQAEEKALGGDVGGQRKSDYCGNRRSGQSPTNRNSRQVKGTVSREYCCGEGRGRKVERPS